MAHEDGYCDDCGAETDEAWLTFDGRVLCRECALRGLEHVVKVASKPEARDDGR